MNKEELWCSILRKTEELKKLEELRLTVEEKLPELKEIFEKEHSKLIVEIKQLKAEYGKAKSDKE